eukprot:12919620-Prorocentrum_lima.AAC.1
MDLVITVNGDDISVDVSIASVLTVNPLEIPRRIRCPGRAARIAVSKKHGVYGPDITPFVVEDMGYISAPAHHLLSILVSTLPAEEREEAIAE